MKVPVADCIILKGIIPSLCRRCQLFVTRDFRETIQCEVGSTELGHSILSNALIDITPAGVFQIPVWKCERENIIPDLRTNFLAVACTSSRVSSEWTSTSGPQSSLKCSRYLRLLKSIFFLSVRTESIPWIS
jgi:hypothetical protein